MLVLGADHVFLLGEDVLVVAELVLRHLLCVVVFQLPELVDVRVVLSDHQVGFREKLQLVLLDLLDGLLRGLEDVLGEALVQGVHLFLDDGVVRLEGYQYFGAIPMVSVGHILLLVVFDELLN